MSDEHFELLDEIKRLAVKSLVGYFFVSLGLAVAFYIDTKIELNRLKEEQEVIKLQQAQESTQIARLYEIHLKVKYP